MWDPDPSVAWDNTWLDTYFLDNTSCHVSSMLLNLHNHLHKWHLFIVDKSSTMRPLFTLLVHKKSVNLVSDVLCCHKMYVKSSCLCVCPFSWACPLELREKRAHGIFFLRNGGCTPSLFIQMHTAFLLDYSLTREIQRSIRSNHPSDTRYTYKTDEGGHHEQGQLPWPRTNAHHRKFRGLAKIAQQRAGSTNQSSRPSACAIAHSPKSLPPSSSNSSLE
jgi:hypothetical protein